MGTFHDFVWWAFLGFLSAGGSLLLVIVADIRKTFKEMGSNIEKLSSGFAVLVEKSDNHQKELDRHDRRLERLEIRK